MLLKLAALEPHQLSAELWYISTTTATERASRICRKYNFLCLLPHETRFGPVRPRVWPKYEHVEGERIDTNVKRYLSAYLTYVKDSLVFLCSFIVHMLFIVQRSGFLMCLPSPCSASSRWLQRVTGPSFQNAGIRRTSRVCRRRCVKLFRWVKRQEEKWHHEITEFNERGRYDCQRSAYPEHELPRRGEPLVCKKKTQFVHAMLKLQKTRQQMKKQKIQFQRSILLISTWNSIRGSDFKILYSFTFSCLLFSTLF